MAQKSQSSDITVVQPNENSKLIEDLVLENDKLRSQLRKVSAVGVSMMFHTHRGDCSSFTRDFLKSIISISQEIEITDVKNIYKTGLDVATAPSVIEEVSK